MNPRLGVLAALAASLVACFVGGDGPDDDTIIVLSSAQPNILGMWAYETDDGHVVVREFYEGDRYLSDGTRTTREWYYALGEEPLLYMEGQWWIEDAYALPGGEVADDVLYVYDYQPYYDVIVDVTDTKLVLQGLYNDEPITFDAVDEFP